MVEYGVSSRSLAWQREFVTPIYLGATVGSSHREYFWKIATPQSYRISRTYFDMCKFLYKYRYGK